MGGCGVEREEADVGVVAGRGEEGSFFIPS